MLDRHRDVLGLDLVGIDRPKSEGTPGVLCIAVRVKRVGIAIGRDRLLQAVAIQDPIDLHRTASPSLKGHASILIDRDVVRRNRELAARLDQRADQRLQGLLVLVLHPHPVGGTRDLGDPHLVDLAGKIEIVVPAADVHPRGTLDRQRGTFGAPDAVQQPVHVEPRLAILIGMGYVDPLADGQSATTGDVSAGEVAVHVDVRRADELHYDLALRLLVSPRQNGGIGLLGPDPCFGRVGAGTRRIARDLLPAVDALAWAKAPAIANHAGRRRGARIL